MYFRFDNGFTKIGLSDVNEEQCAFERVVCMSNKHMVCVCQINMW